MDVQIATLCDHAADYRGKLVISGTFDTLIGRNLPLVHQQCSLALRLCMTTADTGVHKLTINLIDADGKPIDARLPIPVDLPVSVPDSIPFITKNIVMSLRGLQFTNDGLYSLDVAVNETIVSRIPLRVLLKGTAAERTP